jgi:hypothetical protein
MLTASKLRKLLSYSKSTGTFRWRERLSNCVHVGDIAGDSNHVSGMRRIGIDGVSYFAQMLAVLHVTGKLPKKVIFKNGVRSDTRWRNLRVE